MILYYTIDSSDILCFCRLSEEYGMWGAGFPKGHSLLQAGEGSLWIMGYAGGLWLSGGPPGLHITHKHVLNEFPEKLYPLLLNESDESWCSGHREPE